MIRPVLTELALFLTPFLIYAVFLWGTRTGVLDPARWSLAHLAWLAISALILMIGSFIVLSHFSGSRPGSQYTPAHVENGVLVPERIQ